jgi:hypothetical protein
MTRATIDRDGRIALDRDLQMDLGVQPGDDVLIDRRGNDWVIKAASGEWGLCLSGNVLVHRGTPAPCEDEVTRTRDERFEQLTEGLPR